jgi:hypothetical protein
MIVYVLSTLVENEQRPVAVVTDEHAAEEWGQQNDNNDYILFELDDLSLTGMGSAPTLKPALKPKTPPAEQVPRDIMQQVEILTKANTSVMETNKKLEKMVRDLIGRLKKKGSTATNPILKKGASENPLLKKANESAALLWRAPEDNERHDYQPSWDYELNETPDPELAAAAKEAAVRVYQRMKVPFELWAVDLNTASHDAAAMYVDGTCGYPVVLVDLEQHRGYEDQFGKSIDHELKHALQESEGREYSEEEAEQD